MTTPAATAPAEKGPLSMRISAEERAALEYLLRLFPDKYGGLSSVLTDYSLADAVSTYRRAMAMAAESAS